MSDDQTYAHASMNKWQLSAGLLELTNDRLWVEAGAVDQACSQAIIAQRWRVILAVDMMH
jgi:hypothetical protein